MARKLQQLINYHTSGSSMPSVSDVHYGEIVVRHKADQPELLVKVNEQDFAVFQASGAVKSQIDVAISGLSTTLNGRIDEVEKTVEELSGVTSAFSASVVTNYATSADTFNAISAVTKSMENYATSADTHNAIAAAKSAAISSGKTYTDALSGNAKAHIDAVELKQSQLSAATSAFSATVISTYATSADTANAIKAVDDKFANYATSAATVSAIATAKDEAISSGKSYTDALSANAKTHIDAVEKKVTDLSGETVSFSGSVVANYATSADTANAIKAVDDKFDSYATSADTDSAIAAAKSAAISSGKTYTDALSGNAKSHIDAVELKQSQLSAATSAFSASVVANYATSADTYNAISAVTKSMENYATSADTVAAINSAATFAVNSGKTYTDALSGNAQSHINAVDKKLEELSGSTTVLSASVISASASMLTYINTKLSTVFKYSGSVETYEDLPESAESIGVVFNVRQAHGTPGESGYTPAGTNYAWTGSEWDPLGGTFDFSSFATKTYVDGKVSAITETTNEIAKNLEALSGVTSAFSASVVSTYATSADTANAIKTVDDKFANYATSADTVSAIDSAKDAAITSGKSYTDALSGNAQSHINAVALDAANLSASTIALSGAVIDNELVVAKAINKLEDEISAITVDMSSYAKSADTYNAISSLSANTKAYVDALSGNAKAHIDAVEKKVTDLSGETVSFSGSVVANYATSANTVAAIKAVDDKFDSYATSADTVSAIDSAATFAVNSGKSYTDALSGNAKAHIDAVEKKVTDLSGETVSFSGSVVTNYATSANTVAAIKAVDDKFASYATSADTVSAIDSAATFAVNSGKTYTDALSGNAKSAIDAVALDAANLSASTIALSGAVIDNELVVAKAINKLEDEISAITVDMSSYAKSADTYNAISSLSANTKAYVDALSGNAKTAIDAVSLDVTNLSAATVAIETTANSALQSASLGTVSTATSTQSGAKLSYTSGGAVVLDLSELIIDCGDF